MTRGRADADLNYGHESDEQGTKFKEVALPPGFLDDPQNEIVRTTLKAPDEQPVESAPRGAARDSDPSSGRETWNRTLRPRHRSVVRQYFDSK